VSDETILDHGFVPEEHAPDPVIGHGDPTPPGKVAIWLFLASEIMFFIGILATYIIFRSGSAKIFGEHAQALNKSLAGINTLVLIFSSLTMALAVDASQKGNRNRTLGCLALTLLCAFGFMGIKYIEYSDKLGHHTIVATEVESAGAKTMVSYVYDGHKHEVKDGVLELTHATRARLEPGTDFNIGWMSHRQVEELAKGKGAAEVVAETGTERGTGPAKEEAAATAEHVKEAAHTGGGEHGETFHIPVKSIAQDITYGPWKNIFYACYFTLTGVHGLHVLGGIVAISMLMVHAMRGKILPAHTEYVGLYWHFVDLVWIFLFPLLYLI